MEQLTTRQENYNNFDAQFWFFDFIPRSPGANGKITLKILLRG